MPVWQKTIIAACGTVVIAVASWFTMKPFDNRESIIDVEVRTSKLEDKHAQILSAIKELRQIQHTRNSAIFKVYENEGLLKDHEERIRNIEKPYRRDQ